MKKLVLLIGILWAVTACNQGKETQDAVTESSGLINNVSVIINNDLWNSVVGDSIRYKLAAEVEGLPMSEPLFSLNQYPENIFKGFMKNSRNIVIVQRGHNKGFSVTKNQFATPQNVFYLLASTNEGIIELLEKNADSIINTIKRTEILEKQKRIKKSLLSEGKLIQTFGLSMKIPSAYQYAMEKDKFFWIKKEIPSGNSSLLIYEVPIPKIEKDTALTCNITTLRDSIGKLYVHGPLQNTYMVTEDAYAPYFYKTHLDHKPTYLTKGVWELKNDFMAGPFVNYAIKDEKNNRFIIVEGFVYAPSKEKRDLVQELEAIISSATFKQKKIK